MPFFQQTTTQSEDKQQEIDTGLLIDSGLQAESSAQNKILQLSKFKKSKFKSGNNIKEFDVTNNVSELFTIFEPTVNNLKINRTSYGEIVLNFEISDPSNVIDHMIIMCDYYGILSPLGALAKIDGRERYSFIDQETFQYPGLRKYIVYIVTKSNTILELTDSVNYEVKRNISRDLITSQVKKNQNENPGIRNDPKTAGDFYNEKNIRNRARRKRAINSVENIVNNTSIVIE
jgi:hypothetical protein